VNGIPNAPDFKADCIYGIHFNLKNEPPSGDVEKPDLKECSRGYFKPSTLLSWISPPLIDMVAGAIPSLS